MKNIHYLAFFALSVITSGCISYESRSVGRPVVMTNPPVVVTGQVLTTLPEGYRPHVYRGTTYYTYNNLYYRSVPNGYVVVDRPW